jgi:cobalt-zinc-cadmium efflux system protein
MSGSLALLSDAMHNFSDVLALVIAYIANQLAARPNTESQTFGYKRAEIIAALFNASVLIGIAVFLIVEAFHKLYHPEAINSVWVIGLGLLSILLNAASVLLIKNDAQESVNIKAAYLHLLTDVMTSIAVVGGGLLMYYFHLFWVDPVVSLLIALYLIRASIGLLKESTSILMQFTPAEIELENVVHSITSLPEIKNIHHIHLWKLDDHRINLEAHLDFNDNITLEASGKVIDRLGKKLHREFGIDHTTFQCEYNRDDDKSIVVQ